LYPHTLRDQIVGMHINTIGTAIDLRCAQVSEIDQIFGKVGLAMKVDVNAPSAFMAAGASVL
jgi:hypothetical protein